MFAGLEYGEPCPIAERVCSEAVWFEHRLLLGTQADLDDIVRAATRIYECRDQLTSITKTSVGVS